jgi:aldose 1-epimerase
MMVRIGSPNALSIDAFLGDNEHKTIMRARSAAVCQRSIGAMRHKRSRIARRVLCLLALGALCGGTAAASAQPYSARRSGEVVQLEDARSQTIVSILPAVGDIAFAMTIKGHDILRWPYASVEEFKSRPTLSGIPFVGPWANRLDEQAFYANGKRYPFDMALGNVRGAIPIHGFLTTTDRWQVLEVKADKDAAWVTSRLEFFREPSWMKQWPFAHTIELTYRLAHGELEVRTAITNLSAEPMPVAIGFHPYFRLTDSPRNTWTAAIGARTHWLLAPTKVPTGETESADVLFPNRRSIALDDFNLDDVFSDLDRDPQGRATMSVVGKSQRLDVVLGANFRSVVIWAPHPENRGRGSQNLGAAPAAGRGNAAQTAQDRNFICIEPMAAVTDAINLAHQGRYSELQSIAPGGVWRESFWVKPSGF